MSTAPDVQPLDLAVIVGSLSSDPEVSVLASGSTLYRYQVTVRTEDYTESIPVSWIDPPRPPAVGVGDAIVVVGRVHRRFFRAGGSTRSSTEVQASSLHRASRRASRRKAITGVIDLLTPFVDT